MNVNFDWESEDEKMLRYMKISPKKRLEWLYKIHECLLATATPERRKIFWRLRGIK